MKKLIVNADDFGWSKSVNRGIIDCYRNGIVTSASLLANGDAFEDAVKLAKENPNLSVGVHLNFYRGMPLLPESGKLPLSVVKFVAGMFARQYSLQKIENEFRAQIEKILKSGIKLQHLDSEKHLHHWPAVFRIVCGLAAEYEIKRVRMVREGVTLHPVATGLSMLSMYNKNAARQSGLLVADRTIGVASTPTDLYRLEKILKAGKGKLLEFIVHPGYVDTEFLRLQGNLRSKLTYSRERELKTLISAEAKELVKKYEYTLDYHTG